MGQSPWGVMRPCAESGSQMRRSGEKIDKCHIKTGEKRYSDALISGSRGTKC
jgi:hypothetical protein